MQKNVELIDARSGTSGLQDAVEDGEQLNSVLKLLDDKEKQLDVHEATLIAY